jgi:hypothetical protein
MTTTIVTIMTTRGDRGAAATAGVMDKRRNDKVYGNPGLGSITNHHHQYRLFSTLHFPL